MGKKTGNKDGKTSKPNDLFFSRFESIGSFAPKKTIRTTDITKDIKLVHWKAKRRKLNLEKLVGIESRHICSKDEDSYVLARNAAQNCLKRSKYKAEDMEMIINCSISKFKDGLNYVYEPPFAVSLKEELGANKAMAFDVNNACAGMMTGVFVLNDFIQRGVIKRGMVVSGECITSLVKNAQKNVWNILHPQLASLTVGDAGAAVIMERSETGKSQLAVSHFTTLSKWNRLCMGGPSYDNTGAEMRTNARKIHDVAINDSPPILKLALKESGMSFDDMDFVLPHQTSSRAIEKGTIHLQKTLGGKPGHVINNVKTFGNTASTTHFVALTKFLEEGKFKSGDNIMMLVYASGLVVGVVIFTMDHLVDRYGSNN